MRHYPIVRNGPDEQIRSLVREVHAGSPEAAVELAQVLTRGGDLPAQAGNDYRREEAAALQTFASYLERPWENGPDLCMVPINSHLIYVKIGSYEDNSYSNRETSEARISISVDSHEDAIPGLSAPITSRYGNSWGYQSVLATYVKCSGARPLVYQASRKSKAWLADGEATFRIFPDRIVIAPGNYGGGINLRFQGDRNPGNYSAILSRMARELVPALTEFTAAWVRDHPAEVNVAELDVDATVVARALQSVRTHEKLVEDAIQRLKDRQAELHSALTSVLPRLGY